MTWTTGGLPSVTTFRFLGTWCSVCHEKQYRSPSGAVCINGHDGAAPETNELFLLAHANELPGRPGVAVTREFGAAGGQVVEEGSGVTVTLLGRAEGPLTPQLRVGDYVDHKDFGRGQVREAPVTGNGFVYKVAVGFGGELQTCFNTELKKVEELALLAELELLAEVADEQ